MDNLWQWYTPKDSVTKDHDEVCFHYTTIDTFVLYSKYPWNKRRLTRFKQVKKWLATLIAFNVKPCGILVKRPVLNLE